MIEEATLGETQGEPASREGSGRAYRVELVVESKSQAEPIFDVSRADWRRRRPFALKASYRLAEDKTGTGPRWRVNR